MVYLVLQKNQVHVPQGPRGGLRYDGVADCLLQNLLSLSLLCVLFFHQGVGFSYELLCQGQKHLESVMADYKQRSDSLTKKEQDTVKDMKIVQEMYARGYEFVPIDISRPIPETSR